MNPELLHMFRPYSRTELDILGVLDKQGTSCTSSSTFQYSPESFRLTGGKFFDIHRHPRFYDSGVHSHETDTSGGLVEMVYVCAGQRTVFINGSRIDQQAGELLITDQHTEHHDLDMGKNDAVVGFLIRPEFFLEPLSMTGSENSDLRRLLTGSLRKDSQAAGRYMYFHVAEAPQIQNLTENLIWNLVCGEGNARLGQHTLRLLILSLLENQDKAALVEENLLSKILAYIEGHYVDGSLYDLANKLCYESSTLSKNIKRLTGSNFLQLMQSRRISQAKTLLKATNMPTDDIARRVGYENLSFFYQLFQEHVGLSPGQYRNQ